MSGKCLTFSVKLLFFCARTAFAGWGWLWLFSFGSKQWFCPYKTLFTNFKEKQCTSWMRNPKCKAIALLLAIGRTIPSRSSTSAGCFACKQDSGRTKALGIRRRCRTAPTGLCRTRRRSIVKVAVLYTNWLAPGFNIDSRSRQAQFYQSPNCLCQTFEPWLSLWPIANFNSQQFLWHSYKNHTNHKLIIFTPL